MQKKVISYLKSCLYNNFKIINKKNTFINIGRKMTGRTSDVTGVSSPIVILYKVYL